MTLMPSSPYNYRENLLAREQATAQQTVWGDRYSHSYSGQRIRLGATERNSPGIENHAPLRTG